jgi:poly-gamma-glutamate system protein
MKKIYWRPSKVPRIILVVMGLLAVAAILSVELIKSKKKLPFYAEKIQAAQAMKNGMEVIKKYRVEKIAPIDLGIDPSNSGMIGGPQSPITSTFGHLQVKQTTINPNWAAVMVEMYKKAGLREGDVVAMGFSGSFPALNLAALVAAQVLNLRAIPVTSVAASTWGANIPSFTWLDMEEVLSRAGIISFRTVAASLGGKEDMALKRSKEGRELLQKAIERNGVRALEFESTTEDIDMRMAIYREFAKERPIAAYVNVGGGTVSVGTVVGKRIFQPGVNRRPPPGALSVDGVMTRFAREGKPVIHMVYIDKIADKYGLPKDPPVMPRVGEGQIFLKIEYNRYLVAINLALLLCLLYVLLRSDVGYRVFGSSEVAQAPKHPEPMV